MEQQRPGCSTGEKKRSSDNPRSDQLHLFLTGELYDCTLKVAGKEFKCHKLLLSMASGVFENMFFNNSCVKGKDDPIDLGQVSSQAFECAMRFVYGRDKNFKNVEFAVEVYKFAFKNEIDSLIKDLDQFIIQKIRSSTVLEAYEMYSSIDHDAGKEACKLRILMDPYAVLASDYWQIAELDTVQDLLAMDTLKVAEEFIVQAVIRWGRAQVQLHDADPNDGVMLRSKIDPCLKLIRFESLDSLMFARLAMNELKDVLSFEEKFSIQHAILLQDWSYMPAQFLPIREARIHC